MSGEIIVIHVGQCGNQIGEKFWEALAEEHGIDSTGNYCGYDDKQQLEKINVFFNSTARGGFAPRAVFVDLEPGVLDAIRSRPSGQLFHPNNFIYAQAGAGNNWAKGYYTEGAELVDSALNIIRKEAELCDNLQGFIFTHSIGGGVGSGMGTLLISKLREAYSDKVIATFTVFPSPKVSDTVVEPYNATLSIHQLTKNADLVFCLDNEALYDICYYQQGISSPTYGNLNQIIVSALSGVTAPLRFPSQGENCLSTLQDMVKKLVPNANNFPNISPLHFLNISLAPIFGSVHSQKDIEREVFSGRNMLTSADTRSGKYLSAVGIFRGQITKEMSDSFLRVTAKEQSNIDISKDNIYIIQLQTPRKGIKAEVALISNATFVQNLLKRIEEQFTIMFRRKAFLHWYTGEGMDEMEFTEAESNLSELVVAYQDIANDLNGTNSEEETE